MSLNSSLTHTYNDVIEESWLPKWVLINSSESVEFCLHDLVPGSTYLVCVEAKTSAGFGNATCDIFSTKDSAPDAPASIWSSEETESSLKIQWDPPVHKNGALTGYKLNSSLTHTYNDALENSWVANWVSINSSDSPEFYLENLVPGSTYLVCVEAQTSAGFGNAICGSFRTKDSVPDAPAFIWSTEQTERSLKIEWDPPVRKNGILTGYKLNSSLTHTFNDDMGDSWLPKSVLLNSSDSSEFYIQDLVPGSTYLVCIAAKTSAGFGNAICNNISTKTSVPDAPASIWSSEESESSLKIQWDPPVTKNGALTGYKLHSSLTHTFNDILVEAWPPKSVSLNSSGSPEFYLQDLVPGSTYLVCIEAKTSAGFGNAVCDNFSTKASAPDAPAGIWSSEQTGSSLKVQWDPPVRKNGALTDYKLNCSLSHTYNGVPEKSWLPRWASINSSDSTELYLQDLEPGSTYLVCVSARTSAGFGKAICDNFSTKDLAPDAPADIWSSEQTESSLKIQWDPPVRKNGALTGYKLNSSLSHTYNAMPTKSWLPKSVSLSSSDSTEFYLQDLVPGSTYLVCVEAETSAGLGNAICDNLTTTASAPDAPASLWSSEQTESSLKIHWNPPLQKNGALRGYKMNCSLSHTFNGILASSGLSKPVLLSSSGSPEFDLRGLDPGSTYLVCVEAKTSAGYGDAICDNFSTEVSAPEAPAGLWSSEQTESSLKIQWDPPIRKNGALTGYKFNYSLSHTFNEVLAESWHPKLVLLNTSDSPELYLQDLVPGSTYLVCIEAKTTAGFGNATCENFVTKDSVPDAPTNIWSSEQTESSLNIQWDPPVRKNGALTGYKLNCSLFHTFDVILTESWLPQSVLLNSSDSPEFYLQSLVPGSTYLVCVEAETSAGFGNALCDNFTTNDSAPEAPASIWLSEQTESSLKIQWNPPVRKNGALVGYKLNISLTHTHNGILAESWLPNSVSLNSSDLMELYLRDLFPGSTYLVCVEAETSAGFGNATCHNFSTKASVPEVHVQPKVGSIVPNKVSIMLNPVDFMKGPITGYYVVVLHEGEAIPHPVKLVNRSTSQDMGLGYYVTAHLTPDQLEKPMEFVVGSGDVVGGFENVPLTDATTYRFGLLAESNFSGEVLHGYSLTAPVTVNGGSSAIEASIVIGAGLLLLILITAAGLTFCCIRRRRTAAHRSESSATQTMKELQSSLPKPDDNRTSESCTTPNTESSDCLTKVNEAHGGLPSEPVAAKRLQEHVSNGDGNGMMKEESCL